jgi:hypothetical protein
VSNEQPTGNNDGEQPGLALGLDRMTRRRGQVELRLRLDNPRTDRALHYISQPRAIIRNDATGVVEVRLTDDGREPIPGAVHMLPSFDRVDPSSTALLTVRLPATVVRMSPTAGPNGEIQVEELPLGADTTIEVVIGWSDTAYYPDPRDREATAGAPHSGWEQAQSRLVVPPRRPPK